MSEELKLTNDDLRVMGEAIRAVRQIHPQWKFSKTSRLITIPGVGEFALTSPLQAMALAMRHEKELTDAYIAATRAALKAVAGEDTKRRGLVNQAARLDELQQAVPEAH